MSVYDEQRNKGDQSPDKRLEFDATAARLRQQEAAGRETDASSQGESSGGALDSSQLAQNEAANNGAGRGQDKGSLFRFRRESNDGKNRKGEKPKPPSKAKGLLKSKWAKVIAWGGGGSAIGTGIILIILFLGSLSLPNFGSHILVYQFARAAREALNTNNKVTGQKITIDRANDNAFRQAMERYKNLKNGAWDKINNYRPKKLVDRMQTTGTLDYQLSEPKGVFKRITIEKVFVNGVEITPPAVGTINQIRSPIQYIRDAFTSRREIKQAVNEALRGRNFLVRSKVAAEIRARLNVRLYAWDKEQLRRYRGASAKSADLMNAKQSYDTATNKGASGREGLSSIASEDVARGARLTLEAAEACVADPKCLEQAMNEAKAGKGSIPGPVRTALSRAFDADILRKFLNVASPTYAIALPLCLIYEGSISNSGPTIDANSEEAQRTFYRVASGAHQQQAGESNGEAIGALNRQLGDIGESNPERRARGEPVNTTENTLAPQASAGGSYSADIFDTFLTPAAAGVIRSAASPLCSVMTSPWTGVALVGATLLPGVGQALQATGQFTMRTLGGVIVRQVGSVFRQLVAKKNLKQLALIVGATEAGTLLAQLLVLQHTASGNNGLAQGTDYANQADMGGNLAANDLGRVQNYGVPLEDQQVNELKPLDAAFINDERDAQSVYERYFAVSNPGSVANEVAVRASRNLNTNGMASLVTGAMQMLNPYKLFGSLINPMQRPELVTAATIKNNSDYNNVQWGWPKAEEEAFENDPKYQMFANQEALDASGKEEEIAEKYGKCFNPDVTMGMLLAGQDGEPPSIYRNENGTIINYKGDCSPLHLGMKNPTYGDLVFRWRIAMRYDMTLNNLIDAQGQ